MAVAGGDAVPPKLGGKALLKHICSSIDAGRVGDDRATALYKIDIKPKRRAYFHKGPLNKLCVVIILCVDGRHAESAGTKFPRIADHCDCDTAKCVLAGK
jgi:hypothetical protein